MANNLWDHDRHNIWKVGSRWDSKGRRERSILEIFLRNNVIFVGGKYADYFKKSLKPGALVGIADGESVVALALVITNPGTVEELGITIPANEDPHAWTLSLEECTQAPCVRVHIVRIEPHLVYCQGEFHRVRKKEICDALYECCAAYCDSGGSNKSLTVRPIPLSDQEHLISLGRNLNPTQQTPDTQIVQAKAEGARKVYLAGRYERDPKLRDEVIKEHGTTCMVCGFNFEQVYGELGRNYIEVHHKIPISDPNAPAHPDPKHDMTVLCSNCHCMIHHCRNNVLSIEDLKAQIIAARRNMPGDHPRSIKMKGDGITPRMES
ncbi:MAG: HNH endonuclease [Succinivibrio sp.]|nr:HNH endonuclease [Succinivibrio sp.]